MATSAKLGNLGGKNTLYRSSADIRKLNKINSIGSKMLKEIQLNKITTMEDTFLWGKF